MAGARRAPGAVIGRILDLMRLFFAGPPFSAAERAWNEELAAALRNGGHEIFLPQDKEPGLDAEGIFRTDVGGIDWADALVAIMDGPAPDAGTAWEVGYAYGKKPIVLSGPTSAPRPVAADQQSDAGGGGNHPARPALRADGPHRGRGSRCPAASGGGIPMTHPLVEQLRFARAVPLAIDHVLLSVEDLDVAGAVVEARYGLTSIEGGRHPAWGTANRIIPLVDAYIELIAVVDRQAAARTGFGRWVLNSPSGQPLGWAVRTEAIADVARRLGLTIAEGSRTAPDGAVLKWRSAGVDAVLAEPGLPFFIEWGDGVALPGSSPIRHPRGSVRLSRISLTGEPARLAHWLGHHDLPLSMKAGHSGVAVVHLVDGDGEFTIMST
jgi:hypothetical protein